MASQKNKPGSKMNSPMKGLQTAMKARISAAMPGGNAGGAGASNALLGQLGSTFKN